VLRGGVLLDGGADDHRAREQLGHQSMSAAAHRRQADGKA
jgi:hypothetical protein